MLIHGTANPEGEANGYKGAYLNEQDIRQIVNNRELIGKPVLLEHDGESVGNVVSAWEYGGKLDILVSLPDNNFKSRVASSFVASKCLKDFSLGYKLQMSGKNAMKKRVVEVSLVKKGARPQCHIKKYER